jgi:rubrerythrin
MRDLIYRDDVDISLPHFGTDEWLRDEVYKFTTGWYDEIDEDMLYEFGEKLIEGFQNVIDTAESVNKNGKWERASESPVWRCSECGVKWLAVDNFNYCPVCGAHMREE